MPTINELSAIPIPSPNDVLLAQHVSSGQTGKISVQQIVDLIQVQVSNPITTAAVASVGALMDTDFPNNGFMRRIGLGSYESVSTIPASEVSGLGPLAQTSTATSLRDFIEFTSIGTSLVVDSSTAVSAKRALGISDFGIALTSAATADIAKGVMGFSILGGQITSAGTAVSVTNLLNLDATWATTSTAVSGRTYLNLGTFAQTSTQASALSFNGQVAFSQTSTAASVQTFANLNATWATTSTAASGRTYLNLGTFAQTSTQASALSFNGQVAFSQTSTAASVQSFANLNATWATTSTAASGRSFLALTNLATASAATADFLVSGTTLQLANTAISAGTYTNPTITVNAQGRITSATNGVGSSFRGAKVLDGATVNVSNATNVTVTFTSVIFDTLSAYSSSTGRYTPNVAGYYRFNAALQYACPTCVAQPVRFLIQKNNTSEGGFAFEVQTNGTAGLVDTVELGNIHFLNGSTDFVNVVAFGTNTITKTVAPVRLNVSFEGT